MAEDEQKTPLQEAFEQIDEVRAKKQSRPTPLANSLQGLLRPALGTPVRPASPPPTPAPGAPDLYLWTGPLTLVLGGIGWERYPRPRGGPCAGGDGRQSFLRSGAG